MNDFRFAKYEIKKSDIGCLFNLKEIIYCKSGQVLCKLYENCILTNYYSGLMLNCCIFLCGENVIIYDLDSEIIKLYVYKLG